MKDDIEEVMNSEVIKARSIMEADMINELAMQTEADYYIDLGCWAGLLAKDVLTRQTFFEMAVLLDGNPKCIRLAKGLLGTVEIPIIFLEAILTSQYSEVCTSLMIPIENDTLLTSSASIDDPKYPYRLAESPKMNLLAMDFVGMFNAEFWKYAYLKMDLEGADLKVMEAILATGVRPKVIHMEIKDWELLQSMRSKFKNFGYSIPRFKRNYHKMWTIACPLEEMAMSRTLGIGPEDRIYVE